MDVCSIPCSQSVSSALPEVRKMDISARDVPNVMESCKVQEEM